MIVAAKVSKESILPDAAKHLNVGFCNYSKNPTLPKALVEVFFNYFMGLSSVFLIMRHVHQVAYSDE